MNDLIDAYVDELKDTKVFKRLLELKRIIDINYAKLIISLKNKEARYLEAKAYGEYYPNLKTIQNEFVQAKKELYSKPEVIEYFDLERRIQELLNNDINSLKKDISNKFTKTNIIKI